MTIQVGHTAAQEQPIIRCSARALEFFQRCLNQQTPDAIGIRLSLTKTGCSGLSYHLDHILDHELVKLDARIFDEPFFFWVAKKDVPVLQGTRIDYGRRNPRDLTSIILYDNPNAEGMCGCGESFMVN